MLCFTFQWPLMSSKDKRELEPWGYSREINRAVLWSYAHGDRRRAISAL